MIKNFLTAVAIMPVLILLNACIAGNKKYGPMKTYSQINIPDGEFLHYGSYDGGEKVSDLYIVTKKETNAGRLYYRIYEYISSEKSEKKIPENYSNWPAVLLIDPVLGCTLDSTGTLDTNDMDENAKYGVGGLVYWHYQLNKEKNSVSYESRLMQNNQMVTAHYSIILKKGYSSFDMFTGDMVTRFMDPGSSGVYFDVFPDFMKEPIPASFKLGDKATITTKAGKFKAVKLLPIVGDPFIGKLLGPMMGTANFWIEDSKRRLLIKIDSPGSSRELEEISNVK